MAWDFPYVGGELKRAGDVMGVAPQSSDVLYGIAPDGRVYYRPPMQHTGDVYGYAPMWDATPYYASSYAAPISTRDVYASASDVYGAPAPVGYEPTAPAGTYEAAPPEGEGWSLKEFVWSGKRKYVTVALILIILYLVMQK